MCDARLWSRMHWPAEPVDVDLTGSNSIAALARSALEQAPERFIAVGFSMGGIVAIHLAQLAGERMCGVILLDTNPGADTQDKRRARRRQQSRARAGELDRVVIDELTPSYLARGHRARADLLDLTLTMARDLGPETFCLQASALENRPDAWRLLEAMTCPVLVACGAEDELCPPDLHRRIAEACPDSELQVICGAGHLLPLEQPDALSAAIADWTKRRVTGERHG